MTPGGLGELALELHRAVEAAPGLRGPRYVSDDHLASLPVSVSAAVAELCRAGWWRRAPDDEGYLVRTSPARLDGPPPASAPG